MFTTMRFFGAYMQMEWKGLLFLDIVVFLEVLLFIYMYKKTTKNGSFNLTWFKKYKIILLLICFINYTAIGILVPSKEVWVTGFYFMIVTIMFLDIKTTSLSILSTILSQILIFILNPTTLPDKSQFLPELASRIIAIGLNSFGVFIITLFTAKILIRSREDELESNNNKLQIVLEKVKEIAGTILDSSSHLSSISEEQASSMQDISYTSEKISDMTNELLLNSQKNTEKLAFLLKTNEHVSKKHSDTFDTFSELTKLANTNGDSLSNLSS